MKQKEGAIKSELEKS